MRVVIESFDRRFDYLKPKIRRIITRVAKFLGAGSGYVEISLVNDKIMKKNVLAFSVPKNFPRPEAGGKALGEVYLNPSYIQKKGEGIYLYDQNDKSYLEVLAAYNNFSEFYNRLQYLQTIQEDMGKSAKSLRLAKVELEEEKTNTEERKNSYEKLKEDLDQKMKDYGEQIMGKQELLIQTKSSENAFQTLLSNLKKQNEEIQQEISNVESEVRKRLEGQDKLNQLENGNYGGLFSWPTQSRYITSYFHDPDYPYRYVFEHTGIDIRAGQGTAVKAAASGYVGRAKRCSSSWCYSYVMLIHANGLATVYGHLNIVSVPEDKFIARGDVIGYSGGTPGTLGAGPFVTGPHLHFEVRKNGIPVNPLDYMLKDWE